MSTQFWLNDILQLLNPDNLNFFNNSGDERNIKLLNSVSMITIIVGLFFLFKTNLFFFSISPNTPQ